MNRTEIMAAFRSLARSQGKYGRLVRDIESMESDERDELMSKLESYEFKDTLDLVMFVES